MIVLLAILLFIGQASAPDNAYNELYNIPEEASCITHPSGNESCVYIDGKTCHVDSYGATCRFNGLTCIATDKTAAICYNEKGVRVN